MDARRKAEAARTAADAVATSSDAARRRAVESFAALLVERREPILRANEADVGAAAGLASPAARRLSFDPSLSAATVAGVARLPDPVGRTRRATLLDDGLRLYEVTVPIGVLLAAYESRPDAGAQIAALAMRTGNAVLLKGGREAERTNAAVGDAARAALRAAGLPEDAVLLLEGRDELNALLELDDLVDLVIPRGSASFVRHVRDSTRIPVLGHAEGVCHVYVDRAADPRKAVGIAADAKADYPSACNAAECVLVDAAVAERLVPAIVDEMRLRGVEVRADERAAALAPGSRRAEPEDWGREFGDLVVALAVVDGVEEAISWIRRYGSGHTDAIVTEDGATARRFVESVDSAGVFVNASTRFADGNRYGLGAEVGVSTSRIHARGPVGPEGLVTTKWILVGDGHVVGDYRGPGARAFRHEPLREGW